MSDDYQSIPVADARAAVQASGELVGLQGPEYWQGVGEMSFGSPWLPMFAPTAERPYPEFARVIIKRKGQDPREVVISWEEYASELEIDDPEWLAKRTQKPMAIFGAEVERHAYRVVFADVLAKLDRPVVSDQRYGDRGQDDRPAAGWDAVEPSRDWIAEVKDAPPTKLVALYDEARAAGALVAVAGLQQAFTNRTLAEAAPKPTPRPAVTSKLAQGQGGKRRRSGRPRSPRENTAA